VEGSDGGIQTLQCLRVGYDRDARRDGNKGGDDDEALKRALKLCSK